VVIPFQLLVFFFHFETVRVHRTYLLSAGTKRRENQWKGGWAMKMKSFFLSRTLVGKVPVWRQFAFWRLSTCLLFGVIALGLVGATNVCWSADEGGASGYLEQSEALISPGAEIGQPAAVVATFNLDVQVLWKTHGSEIGGLGPGQQAIWKFKVYSFSDVVGHVNPEAFTVTAVDIGRSGEQIRIRVSKVGTTGTVTRYATSPSAASYGLKVKDGDTIQVIVDYPAGFLYGNPGSAYVIQWALQNTGWIVP
jgi:hypothetical protein